MKKNIILIDFSIILPIWKNYLWPSRQSHIERASSIEYGTYPFIYNSDYLNSKAMFLGCFIDNKLVGVNSGHMTGKSFRSRGLYVFDEYRGNKCGVNLLLETVRYAREINCDFLWSIPRKSAFKTYNNAGFIQTSDWFATETSDQNAYACVYL